MNSLQSTVGSGISAPFRKLKVWQKAHELTLAIYPASRSFPREELYGYTSQIRRAALSSATNIVEGSKRRTQADFRHFLTIAQSSNEEVKYLLIVGAELNYIPVSTADKFIRLADEVGAMLYSFSNQL